MSQITVLTKQHRVVDAFVVSSTLFDALKTISHENNLPYFELSTLREIDQQFLTEFACHHSEPIERLRQHPRCQGQNHAIVTFAITASPWYADFLSLLGAIARLPQADALYISLTSR